jgi:hypothetical protein
MIDVNDPREFAELMIRVQARRVAQAYQGAGKVIPSGAAAILVGDTEEAVERDGEAFARWCRSRGVECIAVFGVSDFRSLRLQSN